ncbi:MAG: hypothetical protein ABR511_06295 [Acidimicrobiales bacterium]
MAERAEEMQAVPAGLAAGRGGGPRRVEYGLVFCELPPRGEPTGPKSTRPGKVPAAKPGTPGGGREHGSYAKAVVEGCDCDPCKAAKVGYNRRRRQAIARPDEVWLPYVSAQPARRHLAALSAAGVGLKTVARLSGVSHGALSKIVYGEPGRGRPPSRRVRPHTLEAILAVRVGDATGKQRVSAGPTWQLIDELIAAGYTRGQLARALGSTASVPKLQIGRRSVLASTARSVEVLHRALIRRRPGRSGP